MNLSVGSQNQFFGASHHISPSIAEKTKKISQANTLNNQKAIDNINPAEKQAMKSAHQVASQRFKKETVINENKSLSEKSITKTKLNEKVDARVASLGTKYGVVPQKISKEGAATPQAYRETASQAAEKPTTFKLLAEDIYAYREARELGVKEWPENDARWNELLGMGQIPHENTDPLWAASTQEGVQPEPSLEELKQSVEALTAGLDQIETFNEEGIPCQLTLIDGKVFPLELEEAMQPNREEESAAVHEMTNVLQKVARHADDLKSNQILRLSDGIEEFLSSSSRHELDKRLPATQSKELYKSLRQCGDALSKAIVNEPGIEYPESQPDDPFAINAMIREGAESPKWDALIGKLDEMNKINLQDLQPKKLTANAAKINNTLKHVNKYLGRYKVPINLGQAQILKNFMKQADQAANLTYESANGKVDHNLSLEIKRKLADLRGNLQTAKNDGFLELEPANHPGQLSEAKIKESIEIFTKFINHEAVVNEYNNGVITRKPVLTDNEKVQEFIGIISSPQAMKELNTWIFKNGEEFTKNHPQFKEAITILRSYSYLFRRMPNIDQEAKSLISKIEDFKRKPGPFELTMEESWVFDHLAKEDHAYAMNVNFRVPLQAYKDENGEALQIPLLEKLFAFEGLREQRKNMLAQQFARLRPGDLVMENINLINEYKGKNLGFTDKLQRLLTGAPAYHFGAVSEAKGVKKCVSIYDGGVYEPAFTMGAAKYSNFYHVSASTLLGPEIKKKIGEAGHADESQVNAWLEGLYEDVAQEILDNKDQKIWKEDVYDGNKMVEKGLRNSPSKRATSILPSFLLRKKDDSELMKPFPKEMICSSYAMRVLARNLVQFRQVVKEELAQRGVEVSEKELFSLPFSTSKALDNLHTGELLGIMGDLVKKGHASLVQAPG